MLNDSTPGGKIQHFLVQNDLNYECLYLLIFDDCYNMNFLQIVYNLEFLNFCQLWRAIGEDFFFIKKPAIFSFFVPFRLLLKVSYIF